MTFLTDGLLRGHKLNQNKDQWNHSSRTESLRKQDHPEKTRTYQYAGRKGIPEDDIFKNRKNFLVKINKLTVGKG